jgi:hypothetical protein
MGLKDVLQTHGVPLHPEFDERMDIVVSALRRSPGYQKKLESYKRKKGGAVEKASTGEDFLGPQLQSFITIVTSPLAQTYLRGLFGVIFFVSYLESIPVFGSVLSAVLDLMVAGGKMLVKTVQKNIPPIIGLIPLPYMSMLGIVLAAIFGMLVWPVIAIVSFSRQDFTAAIESFIRVIPPPIGDTIADLFLEGNRAIARLNEKRKKLAADISKGIALVSDAANAVSSSFSEGASKLAEKTKEAAKTGIKEVKDVISEPSAPSTPAPPAPSTPPPPAPSTPPPPAPSTPPPPAAGGKRLSRRRRRERKWKTLRRH